MVDGVFAVFEVEGGLGDIIQSQVLEGARVGVGMLESRGERGERDARSGDEDNGEETAGV